MLATIVGVGGLGLLLNWDHQHHKKQASNQPLPEEEPPPEEEGPSTTVNSFFTSNVTNALFALFDEDTLLFTGELNSDSPFSDRGKSKFAYAFNLINLDQNYFYKFEITEAVLTDEEHPNDTNLILFLGSNSMLGTAIAYDNNGGEGYLSKLSDQSIEQDSCLVVTSYKGNVTGTFTLRITRSIYLNEIEKPDDNTIELVYNAQFGNFDVMTFTREIQSTSEVYTVNHDDGIVDGRYAHYFFLQDLDDAYSYTFETLAANLNNSEEDTILALFDNTGLPMTEDRLVAFDDEGGVGSLSKINLNNPGGQPLCLVVAGFDSTTGTFTLRITRTLK
jgi:hypothetical protein